MLNTARNTIDQLVWEPCHNYTVPCKGRSTSVGRHHSCHMQVSAIVCRMTCFWWQLTHNITVHIIRLSLTKSCLKIEVKKIPTFAGCHLATQTKSRSCRSRGIRLLVFLCVSWKSLNTHLAFALRKLPCTSVFMVSNHRPVTSFFGLTFLMSMRSKNIFTRHCDQVADILLFSIFCSHRAKMIRLRLRTCVSPASLFNAHHQSER